MADATAAAALDPKNAKAHFRRGQAAFLLGEYRTARDSFAAALENAPGERTYRTWIRKCDAEIEEEDAVVPPPAPAAVTTAAPAKKAPPRYRHDFIQTPTHVTITVYMRGADSSNCEVE